MILKPSENGVRITADAVSKCHAFSAAKLSAATPVGREVFEQTAAVEGVSDDQGPAALALAPFEPKLTVPDAPDQPPAEFKPEASRADLAGK